MTDITERIKCAQQGDEEELSRLVCDNLALVKSIAKRFVDRGADFEDLVQIGSIGLAKHGILTATTANALLKQRSIPPACCKSAMAPPVNS